MKILALVYMFELAFLPIDQCGMHDGYKGIARVVDNSCAVYFMLGADICELVTVYGGESTRQVKHGTLSFNPYYQQYYIGADVHYEIGGARFDLNIFRECSHTIDVWRDINNKVCADDAMLKISLSVSGKLDLF